MKFSPKISIVIPVYNGSDFLYQAINSALAQTYSNVEIIVVNDGSNDGGETERVALSYGEKIRYFSKKNGGVASALNAAIKEMKGDYFSWLSHDDLYYPDKVSSQVRALTGMNPETTILYGNYSVFSESPDVVREILLPGVPPEDFRYFITVNNSLHGCTLLVPKRAFDECGTFNEALRTTQDYDLWFRMAQKISFVHIPKLLVKARQHAGQGSVKMQSIALVECNELLTNFVNDLSDQELISSRKKPVSLSYAEIYVSMLQRGYYDTAQHTMGLTINTLNRGNVLNAVKTLTVVLKAKIIYKHFGFLNVLLVWTSILKALKNLLLPFQNRP